PSPLAHDAGTVVIPSPPRPNRGSSEAFITTSSSVRARMVRCARCEVVGQALSPTECRGVRLRACPERVLPGRAGGVSTLSYRVRLGGCRPPLAFRDRH